jgi:hypothetical protein
MANPFAVKAGNDPDDPRITVWAELQGPLYPPGEELDTQWAQYFQPGVLYVHQGAPNDIWPNLLYLYHRTGDRKPLRMVQGEFY